MTPSDEVVRKRAQNSVRDGLAETGLYHSFRLPDGRILRGAMALEWEEARLAAFGLPEDLSGKTVLDIGPWDGYFAFEMERRGAQVSAIDYTDLDTFRELHHGLGSKAHFQRLDVYELDPAKHGQFDIVLCLGVLYHLKHPLLGLEKVCGVTRDVSIVETFVVDGVEWQKGQRPPQPYVEFYEGTQLGGQLDNWSGPTVTAVEALIRSAGFARAEVLKVADTTAIFAAHRHWGNLPPDAGPPAELRGVSSHLHRGRCFQSVKEEYVTLWCVWTEPGEPPLDAVFPEIDGFGVAPLYRRMTQDGLLVSLRLPPGLAPGGHQVRLKLGNSGWSQPLTIYVDLPPISNAIRLVSVQDGVTWAANEVGFANGGWMTLWVEGISPEADSGNTIVEVAGIPHFPKDVLIQNPASQINVQLRPMIRAGEQPVRVLHRGATTAAQQVLVKGDAPPIHGLEALR